MLTSNELNLILKAANQAPSADNSQPWHFKWDNSTLKISYDTTRVGGKTFPGDAPATLLAMGAMLENIMQAADALASSITWTTPFLLDITQPYFEITFSRTTNGHLTKRDIFPDSLPLFNRHTNRFAYQSQLLPESLINEFKNLQINGARAIIISQPSTIAKIADLVSQASKIRFQTKENHEWLAKSLRFNNSNSNSDNSCDGLDVNTLDLPPGGTLLLRFIKSWSRMKILNLFGIYKILSFIDSRAVKKAPALVAIIGPAHFHGLLNAGQLMNRIWIDLNSQKVGVHPYYVITDQLNRRQSGIIPHGLEKEANDVFDKTREIFLLKEEETLQMILRIGHPKKTPVRSKRLPLEVVCSIYTDTEASLGTKTTIP